MSYSPKTDWTKFDATQARHTRDARKEQRIKDEQKRLADHLQPRVWIHAHINTRSDFKSGELAQVRHRPHQDTHFQLYLAETRQVFKASR